jgi:hypothetical protein
LCWTHARNRCRGWSRSGVVVAVYRDGGGARMLLLFILQKASSCVEEGMLIDPSLLIVLIDPSRLHVIAFEKRHKCNENIL